MTDQYTSPTRRLALVLIATMLAGSACSNLLGTSPADGHDSTDSVHLSARKDARPPTVATTIVFGTTPSISPPESEPPSTTIVRPSPDLDEAMGGAFGDVFGTPTGTFDGGLPSVTTSPDVAAPPTTASPAPPTTSTMPPTPPTTVPPTTAPPATAPPATEPPATAPERGPVGTPVAALAASVEDYIAMWNATSGALAADEETSLLEVVFDPSTFVAGPSLTGTGTTFVGRDSTNELLVGLSTDDAGAVIAVALIGHTDNSRTLSAIAALWVAGEPSVSALVDAYLTTIDADVADIALPAEDGGTWTIIDIEQTVGFGKIQNGDAAFATEATNNLLFEMVTLVDPL